MDGADLVDRKSGETDGESAPQPEALSGLLRRGLVFSEACPSREILKHLTSRWGVLVLLALLEGMHRYSSLRRKIGGVSEKMLAQTLQQLEADGFLTRTSLPVVPPHVEYQLTELGREAAERVRVLADWIEINMPRILEAQQEKSD
ncbi:MAG: winged helix-turn-helix transcriptional regulator [Pannonibacter sp.]